MNDRVSQPVCSIDDTRCTVCVPCIFDRPLIERFGSSHIFFNRSSIFRCVFHRICPLRDQSCPFDTMTRCCTIGFERIVRMILVTVQIRCPVFSKMFRDTPVIMVSPCKNMINNASCPPAVGFIACCIRNC